VQPLAGKVTIVTGAAGGQGRAEAPLSDSARLETIDPDEDPLIPECCEADAVNAGTHVLENGCV